MYELIQRAGATPAGATPFPKKQYSEIAIFERRKITKKHKLSLNVIIIVCEELRNL
jgi:hypothetical protein